MIINLPFFFFAVTRVLPQQGKKIEYMKLGRIYYLRVGRMVAYSLIGREIINGSSK